MAGEMAHGALLRRSLHDLARPLHDRSRRDVDPRAGARSHPDLSRQLLRLPAAKRRAARTRTGAPRAGRARMVEAQGQRRGADAMGTTEPQVRQPCREPAPQAGRRTRPARRSTDAGADETADHAELRRRARRDGRDRRGAGLEAIWGTHRAPAVRPAGTARRAGWPDRSERGGKDHADADPAWRGAADDRTGAAWRGHHGRLLRTAPRDAGSGYDAD